jgi:hypothetical protein
MTSFRNIHGRIKAFTRAPAMFCLASAALTFVSLPGQAVTLHDFTSIAEVGLTERIVMDRYSGFAIAGYDPVAYFAAGTPVAGLPQFEAIWKGAAWRFANEGNRAVFMASPETYAPNFGGYDGEAMARGVATAGNPKIFAITGNRLFLFRDTASRSAFLASGELPAKAQSAWPLVEKTLVE